MSGIQQQESNPNPSGKENEWVRLFVALEIDEATRTKLAVEQERLRKVAGGIKWVPPGQIHLTVEFLGDVFTGQVTGITAVLDAVAAETDPFPLEIVGLGYFGPRRSPRVIWAGVGKGAAPLVSLEARLRAALNSPNLMLESRPFHPHFTLGRVKIAHEARGIAEALVGPSPTMYGTVTVDRLLLMQSVILAQGPIYRVIHKSFF